MTIQPVDPKADYSRRFTIFTDGSALSNSKHAPAGWAIYVPLTKKSFSKGLFGTNNVAELKALSCALWHVNTAYESTLKPIFDACDIKDTVYIISDSEYGLKAVSGVNKAKANADLIQYCKELIDSIQRQLSIRVVFHHVNSHTGGEDFMSVNNDIVDKLARSKAESMKISTKKTSNPDYVAPRAPKATYMSSDSD